ncbi:MAG: hypothetical protein J7497_01275 [Chitinophagaceae bacterium]|nr:hypothetical protein [Chitinophagaceae bacterium]
MKDSNEHKTSKPSKGKRLGWPSLNEGLSSAISMDGVRGRVLSADEIKSRQRQAGEKHSPLVP